MPSRPSAPTPAVHDDSPCSATALRKASRRVAQLYDDALAPSGLKSTQYAILSAIARRGALAPTLQELADELVMDRSTLGHNLRPLERGGFVVLVPGKDDRRRRHIALTPEGQAKVRATRRLWQIAQRRFDDVFGEQPAARLRRTLLHIAHDQRLATLVD